MSKHKGSRCTRKTQGDTSPAVTCLLARDAEL